MAFLSVLLSSSIVMIGIILKAINPDSSIGSILKYYIGPAGYMVSDYLSNIYYNYKNSKISQNILLKYLEDIDISIRQNVLDISNIEDVEKFLDYNFILSQTKFELSNKKLFVNESVIDEVFNDLSKNFKLTQFSGLVLGDIGTGKTTLINELLQLPKDKKGLTETLAGESITLGPPIKYNNPNYYSWLSLYDTQGFDKDTNFIVSIDDMKQYIEKQFDEEKNEFVNFIIYCINGERFIGVEKENLIKLHDLYPSNKLQIIVLNTRGLNQNADNLLMKIKLDLERKYNIKDIIFLSVSAIKSKFINPKSNKMEEFGTLNMDKLMNKIIDITKSSLTSTIYKLFLERIKKVYKTNIDYIIDQIQLKNINDFDENYKLIMENCLKVNIEETTLNTIKNHYFKILEKSENEKNANNNIRDMKDEFEKKGKGSINQDILDKYKEIYMTRASEHIKNGTMDLMKNLMGEDFIYKDVITHLENSHKINYYIDKLVKEFKKLNKIK